MQSGSLGDWRLLSVRAADHWLAEPEKKCLVGRGLVEAVNAQQRHCGRFVWSDSCIGVVDRVRRYIIDAATQHASPRSAGTWRNRPEKTGRDRVI